MPHALGKDNNDNGYKTLYDLIISSKGKEIDAALDVASDMNISIIDPRETNPDKIQYQWDKYIGMPKPLRLVADYVTQDYFGMDNTLLHHYTYNRAMRNTENDKYDLIMEPVGDTYDDNGLITEDSEIRYTPTSQTVPDYMSFLNSIDNLEYKQEEGRKFNRTSGMIILVPGTYYSLSDIENAYRAYNSMTMRHKEISNAKCMELYGMTNDQLYICIRKGLDNHDGEIVHVVEGTLVKNYLTTTMKNTDLSKVELEAVLDRFSMRQIDFVDKVRAKKLTESMTDLYESILMDIPGCDTVFSDLPDTDGFIDDGVFSVNPEIDPGNFDIIIGGELFNEKSWREEFNLLYNYQIETESYRENNKKRVHKLEEMYLTPKESRDDKWRSTVERLGWNPNVEFTESNRVINDTIVMNEIKDRVTHYDIEYFPEDGIDIQDKIPIYIVLESGEAPFSMAIRTFTNSKFSHAMISLDSSLKKCFSYGLDPHVNLRGSFIIEDATTKFKNILIKVYAVFVSSKVYTTIRNNIDWFIQNQKKTNYAWSNLFGYLFHIPSDSDDNLICSQFVDKMLKMGNIDLTKKSSSLIAPSDLDRSAKKSKKIYTIFSGNGGKWNPNKIEYKLKKLATKGYVFENHVISEEKEIPVKINKGGDVIIRNLKPKDYDAEYAKSHKLLMEYDKQNNTEAMKTELAKLWTYLLEIEEQLYGTHSISPAKRINLFKVRALIIGDFKKYMEIVQRSEKNFDFGMYYEKSPYSNTSYKISGSTVAGLLKLLKYVF